MAEPPADPTPTPRPSPGGAPVPPGEGGPAGSVEPSAPRRRPSPRLTRWLVLLALVLPIGADLARPPGDQLSARFLLAGIDLYQATLSRRMPEVGVSCRFTPTCSHYAEGAIRKDGALVGSLRAGWRIARCGPWTPAGTHDPP